MTHEQWMKEAMKEAEGALNGGELPIGSVLVAGGEIIGRGQTQVIRRGTITAHRELLMLMEAKEKVWTAKRPLVLYTTLEPCVMCLGACMQCGVDTVVYGMKCAPDGAISVGLTMKNVAQDIRVEHVCEKECVELWKKWSKESSHLAYGYWRRALEGVDKL